MELKRGTVVRTLAGHDKGLYMAVLELNGSYVTLADGKTRPVRAPKKKNVIHLAGTATVLTEQQMESDNALKNALKAFNSRQDR